MANYFVIDNTFRPYSFDELIKPYQMYGEAYKQQEALLDAAREKEFSPDNLDQEQDRIAYDMYNNAASGLKAASDELATRGLSSGLRARIRSTARDYQTTMNNLNQAQERLIAERERRAKLGPDYVFQNEDIRIGDFLNGASPNQRGESLTAITNDIATEFSRRAKGISEDTWSKLVDSKGKLIGGYYDVTTRSGLEAGQLDLILNTDEDTWQAVLNNNDIPEDQKRSLQRFRDVIANKKAAVGFNEFDSDINRDRIQSAINLGATAGLVTESHSYKEDKSYDPLGWSRLAFEKEKYGAAQTASNIALQVKYPQYQFDDKGKLVKNPDGSIKVNPGWVERNGKWYGPNGEVADSASGGGSKKTPFIGVKYYDKDGKTKFHGSDKEWNNDKVGTDVRSVTELSDTNINRLARDLGITGAATNEEVFNEAIRQGVTITVINHGFDKDASGNKTKPKANQEMIVRGTKTQGGVTGEPVIGGNDDEDFDPDA